MQNFSQIKCPQCSAPIQAQPEQIIDVGVDPGAKARLLSGQINHVRCKLCNFSGQIGGALVYHDPQKELLLTYVPVELGLSKDNQERMIGSLINQVMKNLPAEGRKAYLLQPKQMLTMNGMVERILEADGISREDLDSQRERIRLFEQLLRTPQDELESFVVSHDAQMDELFFQLASLSLQSTPDEAARAAAGEKLEAALVLSSTGKALQAQEEALRKAAESIRAAGEPLTREKITDLILNTPDDVQFDALVRLLRQAFDYTFFQQFTERIDAAEGAEKQRLEALRQKILDISADVDQAQEARAAEAASLLQSLLQAKDLDAAIRQALPFIDELFLSLLQANIKAAQERGKPEQLDRLQEIDRRLRRIFTESLPPSLILAQKALDLQDPQKVEELLQNAADQIDDQFLNALMSTANNLEERGDAENARRVHDIFRIAMRISMNKSMTSGGQKPSA